MSDRSRIDDLRRRVQQDPASIAFAQLAEEHRRAGDFEEAVRVCRTGLAQHPAYLSARVTLGRALMELRRYDEARTELEYVLRASPDNLSAVRALAEIHKTIDDLAEQAESHVDSLAAAPPDTPAGPSAAAEGEDTAGDSDATVAAEPEQDPFERALARLDAVAIVPPEDPVIVELERWLTCIERDRQQRRGRRGGR